MSQSRHDVAMPGPELGFTQGNSRCHSIRRENSMSFPRKFDSQRRVSFAALALVFLSTIIGSAAALAALLP
jgi:hypothetical protein